MLTPVGSPVFRRAALVELLALAVAFSGCTPPASAMNLGPPVVLEKADFSTPQSAVKTYIAFTSYAYRLARSDVASRAATPWESVRVDSYIELNRLKDRGIEQQLTSAAPWSVSKESTRTLLAFTEQ